MFKWSCELHLINTYVYDLVSVLKQFKDASEMLIKNTVGMVLWNAPARTSEK